MQSHGIRAKGKRRFKVTADSHHKLPIAPHVLKRQFPVEMPNRLWAGDITYVATDEGWLFLTVVIDLFNRRVVGWSMRADMSSAIVIDAQRMPNSRDNRPKMANRYYTVIEAASTPAKRSRACWAPTASSLRGVGVQTAGTTRAARSCLAH